jgi:UDP-galactopyranose mutase
MVWGRALKRYLDLAQSETSTSFLGRLASYRYMDMHHIIQDAMDFAKAWPGARKNRKPGPIFPAGMPLPEGE